MLLHLTFILQNCIYAIHKCHHKNVQGISSCFEFSIFNKGMFRIVFTFSWPASQVSPLSKINWAVSVAAPERGEAGRSGPETETEAGQGTPGPGHRPHSDLSQGIMKLSTVWSALTSANQTNKTFSTQSLRRELFCTLKEEKPSYALSILMQQGNNISVFLL